MIRRFNQSNKENIDYTRINTDTTHQIEDYSAPFSGYLYKKSSSGKWQKRFFEINGKYLIYYKNDSMEKILAAVSIPQLGDIKLNGEMIDEIGKGVIFQIDLKNKHYYLRTETYYEAESWVKHLLFARDGLLNLDELRSAINNSTPPNSKQQINAPQRILRNGSGEGSIYNPAHKDATEPSSYSSSSADSMDSGDTSFAAGLGGVRTRSRRVSDTTWQKSHRWSSCCIRAC